MNATVILIIMVVTEATSPIKIVFSCIALGMILFSGIFFISRFRETDAYKAGKWLKPYSSSRSIILDITSLYG